MKKSVFAVLCALAAFLCFSGCSNDLSRNENFNSKYGTVSVNGANARAVYVDDIVSAIVTVKGYDSDGNLFERSSNLVKISSGKASGISVTDIPVTKNAVVTVESYGDANGKNKISGIKLSAVSDISSGDNSVSVTWSTTKEGNVYSALIDRGIKTNELTDSQLSSINNLVTSLSSYNVSLIDYEQIAADFGSFGSASSYALEPATLSLTATNISGYTLQVGDPNSKVQSVSSASEKVTLSDIAPGTWTLYALDSDGNVKTSKSITVKSGTSYSGSVVKTSASDTTGKIIVHVPTSLGYSCVYYWGGDIAAVSWPGTSMSDSDGDGYYDYTLSGTKTQIIFNDGNGSSVGNGKTADLYITEGEWNYTGGSSGKADSSGTNISSNFTKVESSDETVTITIGESGDDDDNTDDGTYTVHVYNSSWAGTHYLYAYTGSSAITSAWPGNAMTAESTSGSYKISVSLDLSTASLIFNNNSSQYPANGSSTTVSFPSGVKEAWYNLYSHTWVTENPNAPTKPTVTLPTSLTLGKTFAITVASDTDLTSATAVVSTGSTTSTKTLSKGTNTFNVSDFATSAGTSVTISVSATNSIGTTTSQTTLTVKEAAANKIVSDPNELRIYQVMVSSFQDGDSSIGFTNAYGPSDALKGGDLQGIINALDYIKDLGCNAIWMTPIFNSNGDSAMDSTGYFAYDYFNVDPHFGTNDKLDELISAAHEKGIAIILDGVFGHNKGSVANSPSRNGIQNPGISPSTSNPVDYATNSNSLKFYSDVARYWITEHKIDGWRFDQCYQLGNGEYNSGKNCNTGGHNYWYEIRNVIEDAAASNGTKGEDWGTLGYMVGEDWDGNAATLQASVVDPLNSSGYGLNSCFDFPSYYQVVQGFACEYGNSSKSTNNITTALSYLYSTYSVKGYSCKEDDGTYETYYPNFMLSNHDLYRIGDIIKGKWGCDYDSSEYTGRNKVILAAQAAYSGPITIYYGDEIGDHSADKSGWYADNVARSSGKISGFSTREQTVHDWTQKCLAARAEHEALWSGTNEQITGESDFYVAKKTGGGETIYIAFNYNTSSSKTFSASGTDLLTGTTYSGTVTVPALSAVYILAK